jgi:heterodisulfide reductase subunit A-like polyferredoxin
LKIKTLLCNCKGRDNSFQNIDMNALPFEIESELDVDYAIAHPHLCGPGGNEVLLDVLSSAEDDPDTYVLVAACAVETQSKLFRKLFRATGFEEERFVPVDIRGSTNSDVLDRLREKLEALINPKPKQG